jgi:hypothetical protein
VQRACHLEGHSGHGMSLKAMRLETRHGTIPGRGRSFCHGLDVTVKPLSGSRSAPEYFCIIQDISFLSAENKTDCEISREGSWLVRLANHSKSAGANSTNSSSPLVRHKLDVTVKALPWMQDGQSLFVRAADQLISFPLKTRRLAALQNADRFGDTDASPNRDREEIGH